MLQILRYNLFTFLYTNEVSIETPFVYDSVLNFSDICAHNRLELQLKMGDFFYAAIFSFSNSISSICLGVL